MIRMIDFVDIFYYIGVSGTVIMISSLLFKGKMKLKICDIGFKISMFSYLECLILILLS